MIQWVKEPVLLQQLRSLLWFCFDPGPGNFHMSWVWPKAKKKRQDKTLKATVVSVVHKAKVNIFEMNRKITKDSTQKL